MLSKTAPSAAMRVNDVKHSKWNEKVFKNVTDKNVYKS